MRLLLALGVFDQRRDPGRDSQSAIIEVSFFEPVLFDYGGALLGNELVELGRPSR